MSDVEFTGPDGDPLPDDSSVGDAAWHGGFDMTLDGTQVNCSDVWDACKSCKGGVAFIGDRSTLSMTH